MPRSSLVLAVIVFFACVHMALPPSSNSGERGCRTAARMTDTSFITVKDHGDSESIHLYEITEGRIVLIDSIVVREDPQVDRIVEWRRIPVKNEK